MSLDLYLYRRKPIKEIVREIQSARRSGSSIGSVEVDCILWSENITHNLGSMASNCPAGNTTLYTLLWHPEDMGFWRVGKRKGREYKKLLSDGLNYLVNHKVELEKYEPNNGWGTYYNLLDFTKSLYDFLNTYGEKEYYIEAAR